jgi:hypothetical protein
MEFTWATQTDTQARRNLVDLSAAHEIATLRSRLGVTMGYLN